MFVFLWIVYLFFCLVVSAKLTLSLRWGSCISAVGLVVLLLVYSGFMWTVWPPLSRGLEAAVINIFYVCGSRIRTIFLLITDFLYILRTLEFVGSWMVMSEGFTSVILKNMCRYSLWLIFIFSCNQFLVNLYISLLDVIFGSCTGPSRM